MLTSRGGGGVRGSPSGAGRRRVTLKDQSRTERWPSWSEDLEEAAGFSEQNQGRDSVSKLHFPSLPIPFLPCHFLSNRWLRRSARPDTAQLGPSCVHLPSSAASPRLDPAAGPGPSHSPAPCRSACRRLRLGYWQRDNLPCQQKKPECATEKLSGMKKTDKNKKGGKTTTAQNRETGWGRYKTRESGFLFSPLSAVSELLTWGKSGVCRQKIPAGAVRRKALAELGGWWEDPAAPTRCSTQQDGASDNNCFRYDLSF